MGDFSRRVYEVVRQIPRGRVATYGQVARLMGSPRSARYVGFALHNNPEPYADGSSREDAGANAGGIPCHRVVFADGRLADAFAFGGPDVQRHLLEAEGVTFLADGRVDLEASLWEA